MADRNKRREDEKNRLWEEVMNKKRAYEKNNTTETVELVTGAKKRSEETMDMLKDADSAMEELRNILFKQQKDLEQMSRENGLDLDLDKLYEYYLPILTRILSQYDNLQAAKTDPSYEETRLKLNRTIKLINDAMKTIISNMTDQDFMNLAADISTLEAVLQKDGLTSEGTFQGSGLD